MKFDLCDIFERCNRAKYIHVENEGSYATYKNDETRYLLFQQSNGKTDWKNNFDFPSVPYKGMDIPWKCHRGFLKVWKSLLPYVERVLAESTFKNVVIVGYSHGAALSALCYEYVWYNFSEKRNEIYGFSFGGPKIFYGKRNLSFLENRFQNFINIINSNDVVTKLPPLIMGYHRLGKVIKIGKEKSLFSINAHRPENYKKSLYELNCIVDV